MIKQAFLERWVAYFQEPTEVRYDVGTEFGSDFAKLLEHLKTRCKIHPTEAHWKGGVPERHGGILKVMIGKAVEQQSVTGLVEMKLVVAESVDAKVSLSRRAVFTPRKWVVGYDRALPGSVLDRPVDLGTHTLIEANAEIGRRCLGCHGQRQQIEESSAA